MQRETQPTRAQSALPSEGRHVMYTYAIQCRYVHLHMITKNLVVGPSEWYHTGQSVRNVQLITGISVGGGGVLLLEVWQCGGQSGATLLATASSAAWSSERISALPPGAGP